MWQTLRHLNIIHNILRINNQILDSDWLRGHDAVQCVKIHQIFKVYGLLKQTSSVFKSENSRCSVVEALEAASLHPAAAMNISDRKGTLNYGADADFVMLRPGDLSVLSTWIAGDCVYSA